MYVRVVVDYTAKVQIFEQITTLITGFTYAPALLIIPQRYKFSSKSQQRQKDGNLLWFDPQSGKHDASTAFKDFLKNEKAYQINILRIDKSLTSNSQNVLEKLQSNSKASSP